MITSFYEPHIHPDPDFPIIFHLDKICGDNPSFLTHCHENIEVLYVVDGKITVCSDLERINALKGEMVVINPNCIHNIKTDKGKTASYYCLIVDAELCNEFGIDVVKMSFKTKLKDDEALKRYAKIKNEMEQRGVLYKAAVKTASVDFMIYLCRHYLLGKSQMAGQGTNIKIDAAKKAIKYMEENYCKNISTDCIAKNAGFSKSYFCRMFKETTGYTVISYLNYLRCTNAKRLFSTGRYLISEAAFLSGFNNFSYFSKTYRRYMGRLLSENGG
ncbi:MAG: helix-turn-helix domain-containing protein [Firmicutes bacterium]|nr:helix-turn-helix domain-containing protein [Bacillota bacterium]